jgi:hypothetical protein
MLSTQIKINIILLQTKNEFPFLLVSVSHIKGELQPKTKISVIYSKQLILRLLAQTAFFNKIFEWELLVSKVD